MSTIVLGTLRTQHFTLSTIYFIIYKCNSIEQTTRSFLYGDIAFGSCICFDEQFLSCESLRPIRYYTIFITRLYYYSFSIQVVVVYNIYLVLLLYIVYSTYGICYYPYSPPYIYLFCLLGDIQCIYYVVFFNTLGTLYTFHSYIICYMCLFKYKESHFILHSALEQG